MHKKYITVLVALALILALSLCVQGAMAYFTTYVAAQGGKVLHLGRKTEIHEDFSNWTKTVVIKNVGDTSSDTQDLPCYVRVKYFAGSQYELKVEHGAGWTLGADGYWYYAPYLNLNEETTPLKIKIEFDTNNLPEDFNVVVIHENTDVLYTADGTPYADWSLTANTAPSSGNEPGEE